MTDHLEPIRCPSCLAGQLVARPRRFAIYRCTPRPKTLHIGGRVPCEREFRLERTLIGADLWTILEESELDGIFEAAERVDEKTSTTSTTVEETSSYPKDTFTVQTLRDLEAYIRKRT